MKSILITLGILSAVLVPAGDRPHLPTTHSNAARLTDDALKDEKSTKVDPADERSPAKPTASVKRSGNEKTGLPVIDFKSRFGEYDGCFVIRSLNDGWTLRFNESQCVERLAPCSTFKIFNSLAGLDSGVLSGPDHKMEWDGTKHWIKSWEQDHTLATAIRDSVVWYYQNLAEKIGEERMQKYIDGCDYGNRDISGGIREFWLGSTLKISADEQVRFLEKLYTDKLPFDRKSVETVKSIIVQRASGDWAFSGKTGSGLKNRKDPNGMEPNLGWFVGHVKNGDRQYVFAVNIKGDGAWGPKAREIADDLLVDLGLIEKK